MCLCSCAQKSYDNGFCISNSSSYPMSSGNYGLSDLLAALRWVHYNIEHFGGDRNHVTLLGHQSGGTLVSALMASRKSNLAKASMKNDTNESKDSPKNLFHQVWVTGGATTTPLISFQVGCHSHGPLCDGRGHFNFRRQLFCHLSIWS